MVIDEKLLHTMGANIINYNSRDIIFRQDDLPLYYFQIVKGRVKLNNYNKEGKEFIQNILSDGQSVGEAILFIDKPYPINAEALTKCSILRLSKNIFWDLLKQRPDIYLDISRCLSQRLYFKFVMLQHICSQSPVIRLKALMDYFKGFQEKQTPFSFQVPFTRQQMASLTGLCVETVIRTIKTMEKEKMLQIRNRRVLY